MPWLIEILRAVVILLASATLCAGALAAAHKFHLNRLWFRLARGLPSPSQVISELSTLADAAAKQGVLGIESAAASSTIPLVHHGVVMVIAGTPVDVVKQSLGHQLERSILRGRRLRRCLFWSSLVLLAAAITFVAAVQVIAAASVAAATVLGGIPAVLFLTAFLASVGVACLPTVRDWANQPDATRLMVGTLVIEGICLIGSGKDGRTVTAQLNRLLPGPDASRSRAAAA